ncbi:MAG: hypothetical protein AABZ53_12225 [Planctomycetota bacterium]
MTQRKREPKAVKPKSRPPQDDEPKRGPSPSRLKLDGNFGDRIRDSFKAKPTK